VCGIRRPHGVCVIAGFVVQHATQFRPAFLWLDRCAEARTGSLERSEPQRLEAALILLAVAAPFGRFAHSGQAQKLKVVPFPICRALPMSRNGSETWGTPVGSQNPRPVSAKGAETRTGQPRQLPLQRRIVAAPECIDPSARKKRGPQDDKSVMLVRDGQGVSGAG
jgi:hypothetical protein